METPRRRFIVPGVLPVGTSFWYGDNSVGKTGLAIRTAVALAAGLQWAGRETSPGSVLYVAGEDYPGVTERLSAAIEYLGLSPDDLPISVMQCPDKGLVDNEARAAIGAEANALARETGLPMALIVLDTLATCFGDENQDDATAAGRFMKNAEKLARDYECAFLTVHHVGHRGKEMRGSSVFRKAADAVCFLDRKKGAPTIAEVTKLRGAPEGYKMAFDIAGTNLLVAGGPISVQVVKNLNAWAEAETTTKKQDEAKRNLTDKAVALTLLSALAVDGNVSRTTWQDACYAHWSNKPSDHSRKQAFSNALKRLQAEGEILVEGETVSVSVSKKLLISDADAPSPETVSVSVSTPPYKGGVRLRTDSRGNRSFHEPDGSSPSGKATESERTKMETKVSPGVSGLGSPAERHSAAADADADRRASDAA
jgi:hypothetical protein